MIETWAKILHIPYFPFQFLALFACLLSLFADLGNFAKLNWSGRSMMPWRYKHPKLQGISIVIRAFDWSRMHSILNDSFKVCLLSGYWYVY